MLLLSARACLTKSLPRAQLQAGRRAFHLEARSTALDIHTVGRTPISKPRAVFLKERNLLVTHIEQKARKFEASTPIDTPRLLYIDESDVPESLTSSCALPSLAVKSARRFFAENPNATTYEYTFRLRPSTRGGSPFNTGLLYLVRTTISRSGNDSFQVLQTLSCHSNLTANSEQESKKASKISFRYNAYWMSDKGGLNLTEEDLVAIADDISGQEVDFLDPLEATLVKLYRKLAAGKGFQPAKAVDICHDLIESYHAQLQTWRADSVNVEITDPPWARHTLSVPPHHLGQQYLRTVGSHRALVALGSNVGNRMANIENALQAMKQKGLLIRSTSFLYETKAMYYEDQDHFLNGVCMVETTLEPLALLEILQQVETELGRVKLIDKGPRSIDLDILLYDFDNFQHHKLQIPHELMLEREFVLRPLADVIPGERLPPPHNKQSILAYLEDIQAARFGEIPSTVSSFGPRLPLCQPNNPSRRTTIMAILNVTPDSFSDGGKHDASQLDAIEAEVRRFIAQGATIIDVGGQSTRPGARRLPWQEELARVRPVIESIRCMPEADHIAISVDTFYAEVARGAVAVGADIVNDVSGGTLDRQMLSTIAELQATVVLMHMRGAPDTMNTLTEYSNGVVEAVANELLQRIAAAERAGIPRWRIVLDPGIGFAKTQAQNIELLRGLKQLKEHPGLRNFPWLVGTSRKGFIGKITDIPTASERGWGTAATVTASIAGGADIVRVHDVQEMAQVARMADAMYRIENQPPETNHVTDPSMKVKTDANAQTRLISSSKTAPATQKSASLYLSNDFHDSVNHTLSSFRTTAANPAESLAGGIRSLRKAHSLDGTGTHRPSRMRKFLFSGGEFRSTQL